MRGTGDRARSLGLLILPGVWVVVVLALALTVGSRVQVTPLLAAAPAIACAGTGRRQCVILGSVCALFALVPIPGEPAGLGQRIGTALAIVVVAAASYLIAHRRQRLQRDYEHVHRIADVTQRVLLRPIPSRLGAVATAVGYLSAAPGARVGGDFYDVLETPFGIRAVLGDARGCGLDALSGAAALLGAFREAASYEADLGTVAFRLDAALTRHANTKRAADDGGADLRAEDFATAILLEISGTQQGCRTELAPPAAASGAPDFRGSGNDRDGGGIGGGDGGKGSHSDSDSDSDSATISIISCGHPAPYLLRPGQQSVEPLETDCPAPPLGLYELDLSSSARTGAPAPATPQARSLPFCVGTSVVLCTDGILDARDRTGAFFPIADVLNAAVRNAPVQNTPAQNIAAQGATVRETAVQQTSAQETPAPRPAPSPAAAVVNAIQDRLIVHTKGQLRDDAAVLVLSRIAAHERPTSRNANPVSGGTRV
jgi:hypothetical protein